MPDQRYLLPTPRIPWWKHFNRDQIIAASAVLVACAALIVACWQAHIAEQTRLEAKKASDEQAADVKSSRLAAQKSAEAAERSANAAEQLAGGMSRSASAAEISAKAGLQSLALNQRAFILSNRPNIAAINFRLSQDLAVGVTPAVNVQIVNFGKGTAFKLVSKAYIDLEPRKNFVYPPVIPPPSVTDLLASSVSALNLSAKLRFSLTLNQLNSIKAGLLTLYAYGISTYEDRVLEKPRKNTLYWCGFYDLTQSDPKLLAVCPEHNLTEP